MYLGKVMSRKLHILMKINLIDMNMKLACINDYLDDTLKQGNNKTEEFVVVIDYYFSTQLIC